MKKSTVILGLLLIAAAGVVLWPRTGPKQRTGMPAPTVPDISDPRGRIREWTAIKDTRSLRTWAAQVRKQARQDKTLQERFLEWLKDGHEDPNVRDVLAFVLGSLPDPDVQKSLATQLVRECSRDPELSRILLYALAAEKTPDYDDFFDLPDGPWVVDNRTGLRVQARAVLNDDVARLAVLSLLRLPQNADLRWTAARTLRHSTEFQDVRNGLRRAFNADPSPLARSEYGLALAEWAVQTQRKSPEAGEVLSIVLARCRHPDEGALRYTLEVPLAALTLTAEEISRLKDIAIDSTDTDARSWATNLLALKSDQFDPQTRQDLAAAFLKSFEHETGSTLQERTADMMRRLGSNDRMVPVLIRALRTSSAWSVRESAARTLGQFPRRDDVLSALNEAARSDRQEPVRQAALKSMEQIRRLNK